MLVKSQETQTFLRDFFAYDSSVISKSIAHTVGDVLPHIDKQHKNITLLLTDVARYTTDVAKILENSSSTFLHLLSALTALLRYPKACLLQARRRSCTNSKDDKPGPKDHHGLTIDSCISGYKVGLLAWNCFVPQRTSFFCLFDGKQLDMRRNCGWQGNRGYKLATDTAFFILTSLQIT